MKHRTLPVLNSFPHGQYPQMTANQKEAIEIIEQQNGSVTLELPTGSGKTAIGYAYLKAAQAELGEGPLFYVAPNKTMVQQVHQMHPDMVVAYGRNEHECLYYEGQTYKADEIPCLLLRDCVHRVNQETGETFVAGAKPCPYYQQKYEAKVSGKIVVCTTAFYLFTQLFSREFQPAIALVIDEAHRIAQTVRSCLSYEITDFHLERCITLLTKVAPDEAALLEDFKRRMIKIIKRRPAGRAQALLEDHEIRELIRALMLIDTNKLQVHIGQAVASQELDVQEDRLILKRVETLIYDLARYLRSLEYSRETDDRKPLNYTFAYYKEEVEERQHVKYTLVIKAYYVAPIIRRLLSERTLAYSATIGDSEVFGYESGIKAPFYSLASDFSSSNTRIYFPTDTPDLAVKARSKREPTQVLRKIAKAVRKFADNGYRSLVVVISNVERQKFLDLCLEENVEAISYGNGVPAKDAVAKFKDGQGDVLVGTAANYAEGLDLPGGIAPIIFFLRPGFPSPTDPTTQFEEKRFRGMRWKIWNWRVMMEAMQVRGRNIRSGEDIGVTFFISQQFQRFLFAALPAWLQPAYRRTLKFEQGIEDALKLLQRKNS